MTAYLDNDKRSGTPSLTATHATVTRLTTQNENVGQKLHMNIISFPVYFYDLHTAINCCGTVWPNGQNGIKAGDEKITVRGNFTAMVQKDE
jgi:hypothetical protein